MAKVTNKYRGMIRNGFTVVIPFQDTDGTRKALTVRAEPNPAWNWRKARRVLRTTILNKFSAHVRTCVVDNLLLKAVTQKSPGWGNITVGPFHKDAPRNDPNSD